MEYNTESENEKEELIPERLSPPEHPAACMPMPLTNTAFEPGHCLETVRAMEDEHLRGLALAEYYYFSGQPEKAVQEAEPYLLSRHALLRLSACFICAFANLATDHIRLARRTLAEIEKAAAESGGDSQPEQRSIGVFISAAAAILLHLPLRRELGEQIKTMNLTFLPQGLRSFACYIQAHYAYLQEDYGRSIGIVQTALSLQPEIYPIPDIYLHLIAAMDYMSLRQPEDARGHLLAAWELAQKDDLIEPFSEHHGLLGGMLEAVIKKKWPEDFRRIIDITYAFSAEWRKIHNADSDHEVADNLTTTEFAIAMLAARGWSNQDISSHLGISMHTVKFHIASVLSKLSVSKRSELKKYLLK